MSETQSNQEKAARRELQQKAWEETVNSLRTKCPQCKKEKRKIAMYAIPLEDSFYELQVVMCSKCFCVWQNFNNQSMIRTKDLELKLKAKDIEILKLKLDLYSDDCSCSDNSSCHCGSESESEVESEKVDLRRPRLQPPK